MPRKKYPKRSRTIKAHVTEEEYARLHADATRFYFTMSGYVRQIMTAFKLPQGMVNAEAIVTLSRIHGDLARLGNLFKMALNDDGFQPTPASEARLNRLMDTIDETREHLKKLVCSIPLR